MLRTQRKLQLMIRTAIVGFSLITRSIERFNRSLNKSISWKMVCLFHMKWSTFRTIPTGMVGDNIRYTCMAKIMATILCHPNRRRKYVFYVLKWNLLGKSSENLWKFSTDPKHNEQVKSSGFISLPNFKLKIWVKFFLNVFTFAYIICH